MFKSVDKKYFIILAILILFAAYYFGFYQNISSAIDEKEYQVAELETELQSAQAKVQEMNRMEKELAVLTSEESGVEPLPQYNNLDMLLLELNTILSGTIDYDISFSDAVGENSIARRVVNITCSTSTYAAALQKVRDINNSSYRHLITDLTINKDAKGSDVRVEMTMTCFEYIIPGGEQPKASEE